MASTLPGSALSNMSVFQLGYELSPIILQNGLAQNVPGKMLPIIAITQAGNFTLGLLNGTSPIDPNSFLARFRPAPGMSLHRSELGKYPFLNQTVAANATVAQPLPVSLIMEARAASESALLTKLISFSALKLALDTHRDLGGSYIVATPAFIYLSCILLDVRDISDTSQPSQPQNRWQWDFEQPLLTQSQAQAALNSLMGKVSSGLPTTSALWSNLENTVGFGTATATPFVQGTNNLQGAVGVAAPGSSPQ